LQCDASTNLCDSMECGAANFVGVSTAGNVTSCFASAPFAACGELTWSGPRSNSAPCPVAITGAPKDSCFDVAFESRFGEELTLVRAGSVITVKLRFLVNEVAKFDEAGVWTKQQTDAAGKLNFRLAFDGPANTGQAALRWFTRPCEADAVAATTLASASATVTTGAGATTSRGGGGNDQPATSTNAGAQLCATHIFAALALAAWARRG
jgi:hypothetical protein